MCTVSRKEALNGNLVVRFKKKVCTLFKRVAILWLVFEIGLQLWINVWTEGLNRASIVSLKSSGSKTYLLVVSSLRHSGEPSENVANRLAACVEKFRRADAQELPVLEGDDVIRSVRQYKKFCSR